MAEKEVLFEDNMETQAQDFNNLQDFIGKSIDDVVVDAITGTTNNYYTGLGISKAAQTQVSIGIGRLYWGGFVYVMEDPVIIDFQSIAGAMPVTQQRQIAIVAWGSTIQTDTQPRNFVVDADTGQAQPQSVSMTSIRLCNVGPIPGVEAPSPNYPAVPATNLLIGYVLMNPSGVVSIQQATATQLTNLANLGNVVGGLLAWQGLINGQIATLQTSLAALAAQLANYVTLDMFSKLSDLVNSIWQIILKLQIPTYSLDSIDNFFDTSQSAVGTNVDGAYSAMVAEGLRFPGNTAGWTGTLQLLNSTEPLIEAWDNFILPNPSGMRIRMDCSFAAFDWVTERIQAHPYWTFSPHKLNWARERHRCGVPFLPGPSQAAVTWVGGADPIYLNLRFDGARDTWAAVLGSTTVKYPDDNWSFPRYLNTRNLYYWEDMVDVYYWNKVYAPLNYASQNYGQSFLNAQDGWLGGITVYSMQPAYYQPLTLLVMRCDDQGIPDHQQTIARLELDAAGIQACYENPMVVGDIIPVVGIVGANAGPGSPYPGGVYQYDLPFSVAQYYQSIGYTVLAVPQSITGVQSQLGNIFNIYPPLPQGLAYPVRLNFSPVFLEAGKRYAFHLVSGSDHQFAVTTDRSCYAVHQGDFWHYDSNANWFGVAASPKTLRFLLHYLVWGQWGQQASPGGQLRYQVDLQPLDMGGGITSVDVLAEHIIPPATDLSYAVRVNNQWYPFAGDPDNPKPLSLSTSHLPFQIWFTGTTDLMPGVSLTNSQVKLTGPSVNGFYHISTNIPRAVATGTGIQIMVNATNFNSNHTLSCNLHYSGGRLSPTVFPPAGQATTTLPDGVTSQFVFVFGTASGITNYQVELTGGTNGTGDNFVVTQRAAYGK